MALKMMGKKRGMTQCFDNEGNAVTCTVIQAKPNVVTQIKSADKDGYNALQLGYEPVETKDPRTVEKRFSKQLLGHYKKAGIAPRRYLSETRVESVDEYQVGQELDLSLFAEVAYIDVCGTSKGKGYQGVIKRHNFGGGPASHGSGFHRHGGSTGMRTTPGEGLPGGKKAGQMGNAQVTVENLRVIKVDAEKHLIIVEGAVPGPRGGLVSLTPAKKKK